MPHPKPKPGKKVLAGVDLPRFSPPQASFRRSGLIATTMTEEDTMYKIFRTPAHHLGRSTEPDYLLYEGKLYPTATHPRGWSEKADYELRADGKIYRCADHPLGGGSLPDYEIGPDCLLYRTDAHPDGKVAAPDYELSEIAH
jgi:hypothetical protein